MFRLSQINRVLFFALICSLFYWNKITAQNIAALTLPDSIPDAKMSLVKWELMDQKSSNSSSIKWDTVRSSNCDEAIPMDRIQVFRKLISIDSSLVGVPLNFIISHYGASQISVDGRIIAVNGKPSRDGDNEIRLDPKSRNIVHSFLTAGIHTITLSYSNHLTGTLLDKFNGSCNGFEFLLCRSSSLHAQNLNRSGLFSQGFMVVTGILIALSLLHLLIYLLYKEQSSNLYFSLFTFAFAILIFLFQLSSTSSSPSVLITTYYLRWRLLCPVFYFLLLLVLSVVNSKNDAKWRLYINRVSLVLIGILFLIPFLSGSAVFFILVGYITSACFITGTLISTRKKVKGDGVQIVKIGFQIFIYFAGIYFIISNFFKVSVAYGSWGEITVFSILCLGILSIPITMSAFLAFTFAKNNKDLVLQLAEVEKLSALTIEQERQRKILLEQQNEELEKQVKQRTSEVVAQREELAVKNKEIIDSINYAKRIQNTLLAHKDYLNSHLPEHFIYFEPKDIVSGDFYWAASIDSSTNKKFYFAVCDSTGHGVPGAFMSLLNIGFLSEAVNEKGITKPGAVFDFVRQRLKDNLSREGQRDGFDGVLICMEKESREITYSAANNKPILIRDGNLIELGGDRMPVGMGEKKEYFQTFSFTSQPGDMLYIYTDGFADQFGGPKGKKFKYRHLNEFLLAVNSMPCEMQCEELQKMFHQWKGNLEQVDDVTIVGIKL